MSTIETDESPAVRARAVLLAVAVADALGFPLEDYSRTFLHAVTRPVVDGYRPHPSGRHPVGQSSAAAQICLEVARAIGESRAVDPEAIVSYLVPLWRDHGIVSPDPSTSAVFGRIARGDTEWNEAARPEGHAESGFLSAAIPVGMWLAARAEAIPKAAASVLAITHRDPRVLGAGAGIAAAVGFHFRREEWTLGEFLDAVADATREYCPELAEAVLDFPRILSQPLSRAWELIDEVLGDPEYAPRVDGPGPYVVPAFLLSIYYFLRSPNDFERLLDRAARVGGRSGIILALSAALSASRLGSRVLAPKLIEGLEARVDFEHTAESFAESLSRHAAPIERPKRSQEAASALGAGRSDASRIDGGSDAEDEGLSEDESDGAEVDEEAEAQET
jgi:ADP-ribosylglycohydrolase